MVTSGKYKYYICIYR